MYSKPRGPKRLFYQKISIRIDELENKRQFKANYVSTDLKETKELVLYPDKNAFVKDLLDEAWKQIQPMLGPDHQGTKKFRLLEVLSHKIHTVQDEVTPIDYLTPQVPFARPSPPYHLLSLFLSSIPIYPHGFPFTELRLQIDHPMLPLS